jgi:hypothetical protein
MKARMDSESHGVAEHGAVSLEARQTILDGAPRETQGFGHGGHRHPCVVAQQGNQAAVGAVHQNDNID